MSQATARAKGEVLHVYKCQEFTSYLYKDEIIYRKDPEKKSAHIIFNRPEQLNTMTVAALSYITDLVKDAEQDDEVKVIIFEGQGPCFGSGDDASELGYYIGFGSGKDGAEKKKPSQRRRLYPDRDVVFGPRGIEQTIMRCLKATVCKVHGYCYGMHFHIAMCADIVIASEDALFGHPAWRYIGPMFNFPLMLETIGLRKAKDIMLTCRPLPATEAEQCGMVTKVVKREELDQTVRDYAQAISLLPIDGLAIGKQMMEVCLDARGFMTGGSNGVVSHALLTNMRMEEDEWNFMKGRRDKGLTKTLEERDRMLAKQFRMGKARKED